MAISNFGRNLKALRESKGLTQEELGDLVGVTWNSVGGWETRGVERPRRNETTRKLCEVLDCSERDLFGFHDGYFHKVSMPKSPNSAGRFIEHEDGGEVYAPPELCSSGNYFMTMPDFSMGKRIPKGCDVLIDIYAEPNDGDTVLVSVDSCKPELRAMHEFEGIYIFAPDTWEDGHRRLVVDTKAPNAPKMQILGVARYLCMEVGNGEK